MINQLNDANIYEAMYNKEISIDEFSMMIGIEPHLIILHLKELIKDYEEQYNFSPSLSLYKISEDLYHEYSVMNDEEDNKDRINLKLNIADGIRKSAKTIDELKRVRQSTVVQNNMNMSMNMNMNVNVIENFLNKTTPYLCPKCQEKLLDKYDDLVQVLK